MHGLSKQKLTLTLVLVRSLFHWIRVQFHLANNATLKIVGTYEMQKAIHYDSLWKVAKKSLTDKSLLLRSLT